MAWPDTPMSGRRRAVLVLAALRIAYGFALVVAPGPMTRRWLGSDGARDAAQVATRGLGARDALIHAGAAAGALRDEPVRPWLAAAVAGDVADIGATFAGARGLPAGAPKATAVVAGASALLGLLACILARR